MIPTDWARTVAALRGPGGAAWLRDLPRLLAEASERWGLTLGPPFAGLTYHYVASATRADGARVVLKAGVPHKDLSAEIAALRHFDGQGAARLLDADEAQGVFLLERLEPGASLTKLENGEATRIAAAVMRRLWKSPPSGHSFPTVADIGQGFGRLRVQFGGGTGPFPAVLVAQAESLLPDLLASSAPPVLLHGDLHHTNVLSAGEATWLAIDPHGVVGEPAYEVGQFLLNPSPQPAPVLARRLDIFAEILGLDRARLRAWGLVKAVISSWWTFEDEGRIGEDALAVAESLAELPGFL